MKRQLKIAAGAVVAVVVILFLLTVAITSTLVDEDAVGGSGNNVAGKRVAGNPVAGKAVRSNLIIENWSGDEKLFRPAYVVAQQLRIKNVATIIFDFKDRDSLARREILEAAWDAGFDTTALRLIRVPFHEPKTLNIASAVVDSAHAWGWKDLTIATAELHSARTKKVYLREAGRFGMRVSVTGLPYMNITSRNWYRSFGGLRLAAEELTKRAYYEIAVF